MSIRYLALALPVLMLAGCILSSTKSLISPEQAAYPFDLGLNERATFNSCRRADDDPTDWTACGDFIVSRMDGHYLIENPAAGPEDEKFAIRFASADALAPAHQKDFLIQIFDENAADEEYLYGMARISQDRIFIALAEPKFISETACRALGAEDPTDKRDCAFAMDSFEDLLMVMEDIEGSEDYTVYFDLTPQSE